MKHLLLLLPLLFLLSHASLAQRAKDVVKWKYSTKKNTDGTCDVSLTATMKSGWHIYTATPGGDGSMVPTKIRFDRNPDIKLIGKTTSSTKPVREEIKSLEITINYYKGTVTYKQKVKASANTTLTGVIEFQPCDDKKCLPVEREKFKVAI